MFPAWLCGCCVGNYVVVPVSTCCLCHSVAYGFAHTPPCGAVAVRRFCRRCGAGRGPGEGWPRVPFYPSKTRLWLNHNPPQTSTRRTVYPLTRSAAPDLLLADPGLGLSLAFRSFLAWLSRMKSIAFRASLPLPKAPADAAAGILRLDVAEDGSMELSCVGDDASAPPLGSLHVPPPLGFALPP